MDELRKIPFVIAYVLLLVVFGLETGSNWFSSGSRNATPKLIESIRAGFPEDERPSADEVREDMRKAQAKNKKPPGHGIPGIGWTDGLLLVSMTWMLLTIFFPGSVQGKIQGIVSLVVGVVVLVWALLTAMAILIELMVMLGLFFAVPFGTLAYIAIWGFFDTGTAGTILTLGFGLKVAFAVVLLVANQRFLKVKSMVLLIVTSLLLNVLTSFLHGLVPGVLVSIADAVAGIVNAVAGMIWAVVSIVMSIVSVVRVLRVDRGAAGSEG